MIGIHLCRSSGAHKSDAELNREQLASQGKLEIPVLALAGESSAFSTIMKPMMEEVAEKVSFAIIGKAGHWLAEENPLAVVQALIDFDGLIFGCDN